MTYGRGKSLKRLSLERAQTLLGWTGLADPYVRANGLHGATILMYHSVADRPEAESIDPDNWISPKTFMEHARFLANHRKVLALSDLVERLVAGARIDPGTVVLTFDDGYLDNLQVAFPILDEYQLPATLFLPTRYIDDCENQWIDRLYCSFKTRTTNHFTIDAEHMSARYAGTYTLSNQLNCRRAYAELSAYLLGATCDDREEVLTSIARQLKPSARELKLTMGWEDVNRAIAQFRGIEVGSHGEAHLNLSECTEDVVRQELLNSKRRIEAMTGKSVRFFSFPYNRVSAMAIAMLEPLGYDAAVASASAMVRVEDTTCKYHLPRLEAPAALGRLAFLTSGAYPELSRKLLRRA